MNVLPKSGIYQKLVKYIFNIFLKEHKSTAIYQNTVPKSNPYKTETPVCTTSTGDESFNQYTALRQL